MSLKRPTQEYVLTEAKIDAVKANIGLTASGSYTGNATANRAIPHGMGHIPGLVVLIHPTATQIAVIVGSNGEIIYQKEGTGGHLDVTAPDVTNFYVGNVTHYGTSMNFNASGYAWVAIA